ncbi:hypothetical protein ACFQ07_13890, partial [Actinomadura adrarensis]
VEISVEELLFAQVHLHGGPAPVRRFLPELIELILERRIDPGKVFDLTLPLAEAAEGTSAVVLAGTVTFSWNRPSALVHELRAVPCGVL